MNIRYGRVIIIVLDGCGVGEMYDAAEYGDVGSNTLANTARAVGRLDLPNLQRMGLGNLTSIEGVPPRSGCSASYGVMLEQSKGKDTTPWPVEKNFVDEIFGTQKRKEEYMGSTGEFRH